jgi:hypothetical protein
MFCAVVDSTRLSSQLDPEDWRHVDGVLPLSRTPVVDGQQGRAHIET